MDSPVVHAKDLRFEEEGVLEKVRSVMLPLWNAYSFLTRYADVDGWEPDLVDPDPRIGELDGWILSRLQGLIATVDARMQAYELFRVVPALLEFIDDLTNWYIRRSRRRFWRGADGDAADKLNAYRTLHRVLLDLSRVLAPFLPFVAEELHENLSQGRGAASVHLEDFPVPTPDLQDPALERSMGLARTAVSLGRSLREQHKVRVRQPLASMTLVCAGAEDRDALAAMTALVADELNVREVLISEDESALVTYEARPNLKLLGPRLGKRLGEVRKELAGLSSEQLAVVVAGGSVPSTVVEDLAYDAETLLVDRRSREGLAVATESGVTVALDLELTEDLRREGLAREVVNRVQGLRKDSGLALDDRIVLGLEAEGALAEAVDIHWELIAGEVLAAGRAAAVEGDGVVEFEVEGLRLRASLAVEA